MWSTFQEATCLCSHAKGIEHSHTYYFQVSARTDGPAGGGRQAGQGDGDWSWHVTGTMLPYPIPLTVLITAVSLFSFSSAGCLNWCHEMELGLDRSVGVVFSSDTTVLTVLTLRPWCTKAWFGIWHWRRDGRWRYIKKTQRTKPQNEGVSPK